MNIQRANLIVIAGPNGAGKSTTAPSLLKGALKVTEFVNADLIALKVFLDFSQKVQFFMQDV